jgi:hypothetical protein
MIFAYLGHSWSGRWKADWPAANAVQMNMVILHCRRDNVISFADAEELVRISGSPAHTLIEVGINHRLPDAESLGAMSGADMSNESAA